MPCQHTSANNLHDLNESKKAIELIRFAEVLEVSRMFYQSWHAIYS